MTTTEPADLATVLDIPVGKIRPNAWNANRRARFDTVALAELAESIKTVGLLQPIVVRPRILDAHTYDIVTGERRWAASKLAGQKTIAAIVKVMPDETVVQMMVVENSQREDPFELDEAEQFQWLLDNTTDMVPEIAGRVGKSASYVYQRLKLTSLSALAKELFVRGTITAGHAILLARLPHDRQDLALRENFMQVNVELQYQNLGSRAHEADLFDDAEVLASTKGEDGLEPVSVRALGRWIHARAHSKLSKGPWKKDDADLVSAVGACTTCVYNSAVNPQLAELGADVCTDRTCFENKGMTFLLLKAGTTTFDAEGPIFLKRGQVEKTLKKGLTNATDGKPLFLDYGQTWQIQTVKAGARGAVRALVVDGPEMGHLKWVVRPEAEKPGSAGVQDGDTDCQRAVAQTQAANQAVTDHRLMIAGEVFHACSDIQAVTADLLRDIVLALASNQLARRVEEAQGETAWKVTDLAAFIDTATLGELLGCLMVDAMNVDRWIPASEMYQWAELVGIDDGYEREQAASRAAKAQARRDYDEEKGGKK